MLGEVPTHDDRPTRAVVRYHDVPAGQGHEAEAHDVLSCGHEVVCSRPPGGRIVRAHDEPCGECAKEATTGVSDVSREDRRAQP